MGAENCNDKQNVRRDTDDQARIAALRADVTAVVAIRYATVYRLGGQQRRSSCHWRQTQ